MATLAAPRPRKAEALISGIVAQPDVALLQRPTARPVVTGGVAVLDALRSGEHTVAVPYESARALGDWDYLVCLSRAEERDAYAVWRIGLRQRLPRLRIPIEAAIPEVPLDLQAVFNRCYDAGHFQEDLDYAQKLVPPLRKEDALWANADNASLEENGSVSPLRAPFSPIRASSSSGGLGTAIS